jgi:TRAP-type mannitol/chloroaromatic compound transport system permease small subunit
MNTLLKFSALIDGLNMRVGKASTWLVLLVVLISAGNAIMRYGIDWSSNALLEIQWYLFSAIFLLGSGYVLQKNEHIRIDIIAGRFSARTQNWIDVFGLIVFLLPMAIMILYLSWPVFFNAWQTHEMSPNAGGLVRWPVYLLLPLGFLLLTLQGVSELIKRIAFLAGRGPNPLAHAHDKTAELELAEAIREHQIAPEVADIVEMNRDMVEDEKPHEGDRP